MSENAGPLTRAARAVGNVPQALRAMPPQKRAALFAVVLLGWLAFGVWKFGPYLLYDPSALEQQVLNDWQAAFPVDPEVNNIWQTRSLKLSFYDDGTCEFALEADKNVSTYDVSPDGRSTSSGSGRNSVKSSMRGEYRIEPAWQGLELVMVFPGRQYYSASFEPFVVSRKPGLDFTETSSRVEVRAPVWFEDAVMVVRGKGKEARFSAGEQGFANAVPLVRSGAASGEGTLMMRRPREVRRRERMRPTEETYQPQRGAGIEPEQSF